MAEEENIELGRETVSLVDDAGRSLRCYIEKSVQIQSQNYVLLMAADPPAEIFAWEEDENDDDEVLVDLEDDEIDIVFKTARAVLAEQDLVLHRTAHTLTLTGTLPEVDEEATITLDVDPNEDNPGAESEEFQILASFFHEEQEYVICTPLAPLLFFARMDHQGIPKILSPGEFQMVQQKLEDLLFDDLD